MINLTHPAVCDLAYSCFSPDLISDYPRIDDNIAPSQCRIALTAHRQAWLHHLDRHPEPLLAALKQLNSHRLGLYFEALWQFFIREDDQLELIANNVPVRSGKQTLGEFDVIYRDLDTAQFVHLELTYKFYLQEPGQAHPAIDGHYHHWLGPNTGDRLDLRLARLLQHQIRLTDTEHGRLLWQELTGESQCEHREIAFKGRVFYTDPSKNHTQFNPHHLAGSRQNLSAISSTLAATPESRWVVLNKTQWIRPIKKTHCTVPALELKQYLHSHFCNSNSPLLVARLRADNDGLGETERCFITSDYWPLPTISSRA